MVCATADGTPWHFLPLSATQAEQHHSIIIEQSYASKGDWPRRVAAYARDEQEDAAAYADS